MTDGTPEGRIADARRRKAEADAKVRSAAEAANDELALAEREATDAEALAEAVSTIGPVGTKIATVETRMGIVILKQPAAAKFQQFRDLDGEPSYADVYSLVFHSRVHPSAERLDAILDELPAVNDRCGNEICLLAGAVAKGIAGKR